MDFAGILKISHPFGILSTCKYYILYAFEVIQNRNLSLALLHL